MARQKIRPHTGNLSILFGAVAVVGLVYVGEFQEHQLDQVYTIDEIHPPGRYGYAGEDYGRVDAYPILNAQQREELQSAWNRRQNDEEFFFDADDFKRADFEGVECFQPSIYGRFNVFQSLLGSKDRNQHDLAAINPVPCPE